MTLAEIERHAAHYSHPSDHSGKLKMVALDNLDGRTLAAKRAKQLINDIQKDMDSGDLTAKQQQFAQRAAFLGAMLENIEASWLLGKKVDLVTYSTLANAQRRILEEL